MIFTTDSVGRVISIKDDVIVNVWGNSNHKKAIVSATLDDSFGPLLAVSRADGWVEVMNPLTGEIFHSFKNETDEDENKTGTKNDKGKQPVTDEAENKTGKKIDKGKKPVTDEDENKDENKPEALTGLYLFKKAVESPTRLFYCSLKKATIAEMDSTGDFSTQKWYAGVETICSSAVNKSEEYCVFAGKTNGNLCMRKIGEKRNFWKWNSLDVRDLTERSITQYTNISSIIFSTTDNEMIVAGTNNSEVWVFNVPRDEPRVIMIKKSIRAPVNALFMEEDGRTLYFGDGLGLVGCMDLRTPIRDQTFSVEGDIHGSIRSVARHPREPLLASAGLDGYLRVWDIRSTNILHKVNVGHMLSSVFFHPDEAPSAPAVSEVSRTGKMKMDSRGKGSHKSGKSRKN